MSGKKKMISTVKFNNFQLYTWLIKYYVLGSLESWFDYSAHMLVSIQKDKIDKYIT